MAHKVELLAPRPRVLAVQHVSVRIGHGSRVIGALRATLQLDGVDASLAQLVQVLDHAEVVRREQVARAAILLHRQNGPGLFLHKRPRPTAGLRACPVAGGAPLPHEPRGEQTAPRVRHAHRPVREGLKLELPRHATPHLGNLSKRHLAGENHAPGPQARIRLGRGRAHDRRLR